MGGTEPNRLRRRLLLLAAAAGFLVFLYLTALPNTFPAADPDQSGLAGTYTINGIDHLGTEYSGTVTIVEVPDSTDGTRYDVEWIITGAIQRGQGRLVDSILTARWESVASAAPASGRTVYTVETDGTLIGQRFVDGVDEPGTETLFPDP